jgi:hypothetical protein
MSVDTPTWTWPTRSSGSVDSRAGPGAPQPKTRLSSNVILATDRLRCALRGTGAGWPRSDRIEGSGSRQPQARVGQQRARSLLICALNRDACCVCFGVTVRLVGHSGRDDKAKDAAVRFSKTTRISCKTTSILARFLAMSAHLVSSLSWYARKGVVVRLSDG